MKILAGLLAFTLFAAPAFAQGGKPAPPPPAAGTDQSTPPADPAEPAAGNGPEQGKPPADTAPEPDEAPEGTAPVKPADTPSR